MNDKHVSVDNSDANSDKPLVTQTNKPKNNRKNVHRKKQKAWDITLFDVPPMADKSRFHDLNLDDSIMHAIHDLGYEYCSPIQAQILPHTLKGLDAIGKAQTGTGKTAAFLITIIDDLLKNEVEGERYTDEPRALIIAPTRELVLQIEEDAKKLCKYNEMHVVSLVGGMDYQKQKNKIHGKKMVDIVIATPGRLIDFMKRKDIYVNQVECLVLDEADRMLDMGFIPQIKQIVRNTPGFEQRQTQLFSATFNQDVLNLAYRWTYEPIYTEIEPEKVATDSVKQLVYSVSVEDKYYLLKSLLQQPEFKRTIIFTNRRDQSQKLTDKLKKAGFQVGLLSGEVSQKLRNETLQAFKEDKISVMVATDVMARGIHVDDITHVINYNLPENPDDYVHRIGRTGRAGSTGVAISLACDFEAFEIPAIEALLGEKLACEVPPDHLLR